MSYHGDPDAAYGLREEVFNAQMQEGLRLFNAKMVREDLQAACETLLAKAQPVDRDSALEDFNALKDVSTAPFRLGPFTVAREGYFNVSRFNGIRFSYGENEKTITLPQDFGADTGLLVKTCQDLVMRWRIAALGRRPSDYPVISEDVIAAKVEATDFGYDI